MSSTPCFSHSLANVRIVEHENLHPDALFGILGCVPELYLFREDRSRIRKLLAGRAKPPGVRKGTWARMCEYETLDVLELEELHAIARRYPEILELLGLPAIPRKADPPPTPAKFDPRIFGESLKSL